MDNEIIKIISYLNILELPINCTIDESTVKSAYRKLSQVYHPDTANKRYSDGEKFKELKIAEEYLLNNISYVNSLIRNGFSQASAYSTSNDAYERWKQEEEFKERKAREEAEERRKAEEARKKEETEKERVRKVKEQQSLYEKAINLFNEKKLLEAKMLFERIFNYLDAKSYLNKINLELLYVKMNEKIEEYERTNLFSALEKIIETSSKLKDINYPGVSEIYDKYISIYEKKKKDLNKRKKLIIISILASFVAILFLIITISIAANHKNIEATRESNYNELVERVEGLNVNSDINRIEYLFDSLPISYKDVSQLKKKYNSRIDDIFATIYSQLLNSIKDYKQSNYKYVNELIEKMPKNYKNMKEIVSEFNAITNCFSNMRQAESSFVANNKQGTYVYNTLIKYANSFRSAIKSLDTLNLIYFNLSKNYITEFNFQCVLYYIECKGSGCSLKYKGVWHNGSSDKYPSSYFESSGISWLYRGSIYFDESFNIYDSYKGSKIAKSSFIEYKNGQIRFSIDTITFSAELY